MGRIRWPDGTLSHFLNWQAHDDRSSTAVSTDFSCWRKGLIAIITAGVRHESDSPVRVLWLTSPEGGFEQRRRAIQPCRAGAAVFRGFPHRADANERISAAIQQQIGLFGWVGICKTPISTKKHPGLTLKMTAGIHRLTRTPEDPFAQISPTNPPAPQSDPERGPGSRGTGPGIRRAGQNPVLTGSARLIAPVARLPAPGRNAPRQRKRCAGRAGTVQ